MRSPQVRVIVNLDAVRAAAEAIRARTRVGLIAVVKADAYSLGAARITDVLAPVVDGFAYFSIAEAREVGRPGLVLGPPEGDPAEFRELNLRPAVGNPAEARKFAGLPVAIKVDTGMQRFGCPEDQVDDLAARCTVSEFFAHANTVESALRLHRACAGRGRPLHAAATSLLDRPETWFDAVRPGLALYERALRVTTTLYAVRETRGPVGYTGFQAPRIGILLAGYANGLRPGPVVVNGRRQRLLEIGMNTSYVSVEAGDRAGDEVVLLGDELPPAALAEHAGTRPHEVLCRYGAMGPRHYVAAGAGPTPDGPCTTRSTAAGPRRT